MGTKADGTSRALQDDALRQRSQRTTRWPASVAAVMPHVPANFAESSLVLSSAWATPHAAPTQRYPRTVSAWQSLAVRERSGCGRHTTASPESTPSSLFRSNIMCTEKVPGAVHVYRELKLRHPWGMGRRPIEAPSQSLPRCPQSGMRSAEESASRQHGDASWARRNCPPPWWGAARSTASGTVLPSTGLSCVSRAATATPRR